MCNPTFKNIKVGQHLVIGGHLYTSQLSITSVTSFLCRYTNIISLRNHFISLLQIRSFQGLCYFWRQYLHVAQPDLALNFRIALLD